MRIATQSTDQKTTAKPNLSTEVGYCFANLLLLYDLFGASMIAMARLLLLARSRFFDQLYQHRGRAPPPSIIIVEIKDRPPTNPKKRSFSSVVHECCVPFRKPSFGFLRGWTVRRRWISCDHDGAQQTNTAAFQCSLCAFAVDRKPYSSYHS